MALFTVFCMRCSEEPREYDTMTTAWDYVTLKGFDHPKAQSYKNELQRSAYSASIPIGPLLEGKNQALYDKEKLARFNDEKTGYNPINYKRTHVALFVSVLSGGVYASSCYCMPQGDPETRKIQTRIGLVATTSFAAALGLGWKSRMDVDAAIKAAEESVSDVK